MFNVAASSDDQYDETLVHPIARKISSWFPGEKRCFVTSAHCNAANGTIPTISDKVTEKYQKNGAL